ncbi:MAG TPA: DEAD/DEAH box helicase family protein [Spirochaetia bacterium]|nr:DEAD/DEAH box helicase family protein [Spirochaetia bacterium]HRZ64942.1 DEAD/DEAH box helicase family protein [Spirochaetia bacterium]
MRIDTVLRSMTPPWSIVQWSEGMDVSRLERHAVEEYPTDNGPADYALFVGGRLLGILEAKKVGTDSQNVLEQAKRYSRGAPNSIGDWNGYRVPFLYSSNGEVVWFVDVRDETYYQRQLRGYHTSDALGEMWARDSAMYSSWLASSPMDIAGLRDYQAEAVKAVEEAIADGNRSMLLAMATGTGKTFTTVSLVYRLLRSGRARRILFLVDRRALAAQAAQAFSSFATPKGLKFKDEYELFSQRFKTDELDEDESFDVAVLPRDYLCKPSSAHTFVYVATIQRMAINLFGREGSFGQAEGEAEIDDEAERISIPIHAFDVVIADECHRGYTAKDTAIWRAVLEHFDAVKVGLTATPAAHTVAYFGLPIFRYDYAQAVLDGWLVDYEAVKIRSDVRMNGVFLSEGEQLVLVDTETGRERLDQLEDERSFDASEIERKITAPDSNRRILEEVFRYARERESRTGRFPKTLIFAVNDIAHASHSDQLVRTARSLLGRGDEFVQKITGSPSVDKPLEKIKRFRNRPEPSVVVTVDMLSTGVDIPALEFIVFLRPVKSRILWTQMLGRGTRKCPAIHKECFTIFDCFDGTLIEYFKQATDFPVSVTESVEIASAREIIENIWNNVERDYNAKRLVKRLRRVADTMSAKARADFSAFILEGDMDAFADGLREAIKNNFAATMRILRNPAFQRLLEGYDRAGTPFIVAQGIQDKVESEYLFRRGDEELRPQEYLEAFSAFVRENAERIEALSLLLKSPRKWDYGALEGIRTELVRAEFREESLAKAHELSGHGAMRDIISCIKHAAAPVSPLLTAEERVDGAIAALRGAHDFTPLQLEWLGRIREHLVVNLAINEEFFDTMPALERHGGLGAARRAFGESLSSLISELNYHIAA